MSLINKPTEETPEIVIEEEEIIVPKPIVKKAKKAKKVTESKVDWPTKPKSSGMRRSFSSGKRRSSKNERVCNQKYPINRVQGFRKCSEVQSGAQGQKL